MDASTIMLTVAVVGGFTALLTYVSYRQKQSSWIGVVVDKHHEEGSFDEESSKPERFKVTFKTDTGKKVTIDLYEKDFNTFVIGDRAEKKKGDFYPVKLI